MIRATRPLRHEIEVQLLDDSLLLRGSLRSAGVPVCPLFENRSSANWN